MVGRWLIESLLKLFVESSPHFSSTFFPPLLIRPLGTFIYWLFYFSIAVSWSHALAFPSLLLSSCTITPQPHLSSYSLPLYPVSLLPDGCLSTTMVKASYNHETHGLSLNIQASRFGN
ncbi:hypothetical protein P9112_006077 [Eukaryota sp. TZLM1-RC]